MVPVSFTPCCFLHDSMLTIEHSHSENSLDRIRKALIKPELHYSHGIDAIQNSGSRMTLQGCPEFNQDEQTSVERPISWTLSFPSKTHCHICSHSACLPWLWAQKCGCTIVWEPKYASWKNFLGDFSSCSSSSSDNRPMHFSRICCKKPDLKLSGYVSCHLLYYSPLESCQSPLESSGVFLPWHLPPKLQPRQLCYSQGTEKQLFTQFVSFPPPHDQFPACFSPLELFQVRANTCAFIHPFALRNLFDRMYKTMRPDAQWLGVPHGWHFDLKLASSSSDCLCSLMAPQSCMRKLFVQSPSEVALYWSWCLSGPLSTAASTAGGLSSSWMRERRKPHRGPPPSLEATRNHVPC